MLPRALLPFALFWSIVCTAEARAQGQALLFDGVDDLALILDSNDDFDLGQAFTMETWVRVDTPQPNAGLVVTNADTGLVAVAGNQAAALIVTPVGMGFFTSAVAPPSTLATGTWNHHAGTYDGTTLRVYVNGALRQTNTLTGSAQNAAALLFGVRNQTNFFAGALDEVRIWNDVRSTLEIRSNLDLELNGNEPGLVGYYKFDGTGQDLIDSSSRGNDGVLGLTNQVEPEDPQRVPSGITFRTEDFDEALLFDGVDDICTFLNSAGEFDLGAACTLQAWVRLDGPAGDQGVLTAGGQRLFMSGAFPRMETAAQNTVSPSSLLPLPTGEWRHLSGTYDGMAVRLYVDGVLQDTLLNTGVAAGSGPAMILGQWAANLGFFQGAMDEVRVWNVARSSAEIAMNYASTLTGSEPGLVGLYSFDEGSGQTLLDSSGAANHGFLGNAPTADAQDPQRIPSRLSGSQNDPGGALRFDGVDDQCTVQNSLADLDLGANGTLEAWVRPDLSDSNRGIVNCGGLQLVNTLNSITAVSVLAAGGGVETAGLTGGLPPDIWTHVATTYDGSTLRLYVNGTLASTEAHVGSLQDTSILRIGKYIFGTESFFDGLIDEVRIWNVVRSDAEIALASQCIPATPQEGLVAYYKFDEPFGQRIEDSSGYGNHGLLGADGLAASDDPTRVLSDAPACPAPAGDLCVNATDVSLGGVFSGTLIGANREATAACEGSSSSPDIWFAYTPTAVGTLTVTTCGTNDLGGVDEGVDTVLSLHRSCNGDLIVCNDDDASCTSGAQGLLLDSRVSTQVLADQAVWIRVTHAASSQPGPIQLEVQFEGGSFIELCNGDGGDQMGCTNCPCGNNAPLGTIGGCINQVGTSARLLPSGSLSVSAASPLDLSFDATGGNPFTFSILVSGAAIGPLNPASPCFGTNSGISGGPSLDGLRCVVSSIQRHGGRPMDANGAVGLTTNGWGGPNGPMPNIAAQGGFVPGQTRYFQVFYRTDARLSCQTGQNTSQAIGVTFEP